jgi:two-component system, sensor histidine kinase and response regulator
MNSTTITSYNIGYVALSYIIAVMGAFIALTATQNIVQPNGRVSVINTLAAGLALGGVGVWSMHFIGMLALQMDLAVGYAVAETVTSLLAAVVATSLALYFVARKRSLLRILGAGILLGLGVCVMHYLGMYGIRFGGYIQWSYGVIIVSVLIACFAATAALWLAFNTRTWVARGGAAAVMGAAVCAMHYTGMAAAEFICTTTNRTAAPGGIGVINSFQLPLLVTVSALAMAFLISIRYEQKMMFNHRVLESAGPMVWIDPVTARVTYANPAACKHLGYAAEDLLGLEISRYNLNFTATEMTVLAKALKRTKAPVTFETRHFRKDGAIRDVQVAVFLTQSEEQSVYVATFKDITDERTAERERKRQEDVFRAMINSIPDCITYRNPEGVYVGCNTAFAEQIGRPVAEILGRTISEIVDADRAKIVQQDDAEVLATLEPITREIWAPYADAGTRLLEQVRTPLRNEEGNVLGILTISRDVTKRKQEEEATRRAKDTAEEATRMKSDFLANMSHEIRTPMNAIIGLSHLALKTELTPRQRDYIDKVQTSGQHLLGLINGILDFSKVEAGKLDLESSDFALEMLLDDTAALVTEKSHAKGLALVFEVAPDVPAQLVGDSLRLGQVLLNYANNAVKFTDAGKIVISVRASERTGKDVLLQFRVQDTGIGLTPEQMGRLFQSFSQADASTTRKFGGTGLGLAISKKLAELMGGEVGVESEYGKGSTFWFSARVGIGAPRLRRAAGRSANGLEATLPDERAAVLHGARILLVEDNEINQQVAREMLEDCGLQVDVAENGELALQLVQKFAYDLVFMDMQMPTMDGVTATRAIRKHAQLELLPIVTMTANAMEQDRRKCLDAGMNDFLVKPIDVQALMAILTRWVRPRGGLPSPASAAQFTRRAPAGVAATDGAPKAIAGLDTALGLSRMMGKESLYVAMLRRYLAGQQGVLGELRLALTSGDKATAERLAHTTKAVSGNIGATLVQGHAAALEAALRENASAAQVAPLVSALEDPMTELLAALADRFDATMAA